jgi:SAM-dependent methyltransferase
MVFDTVADDYDQSGVEFFDPIAARLCDLVSPVAGEQALDMGCGRGAVTLRMAGSVAPGGSVTAVDVSAAMVRHTQLAVERAGLDNVRAEVLDASALPQAGFDLLTASLVLFFLPDPASAMTEWVRLVRRGGRVGLTTFGAQDETWRQVDALFHPYLPEHLLDPRTRGADSPFASDAGVERLVRDAGGVDVRTVRERLAVRFADPAQWRAWTMGTGQRMFWGFVPEDQREQLFATAAGLLERARDPEGNIVVHQDVRYTLCTV